MDELCASFKPQGARPAPSRILTALTASGRPDTPGLPSTHESQILTHGGIIRTNIEIDDNLMRKAMRSGATTKRAVVEDGLRMLIHVRDQRAIRRLRGKVKWSGDLNTSRLGRTETNG